jgi:DNA repair ATPase RecN
VSVLVYNTGMLTDQIQQEIARFQQLERQIRLIENYNTVKDLLKLARSCENVIGDISREQVNCRRTHKDSARLQELYQHLCENLTTLEQYLLMAHLLDH